MTGSSVFSNRPAAQIGDPFVVPHPVDAFDEVLQAIAETLDVRDVFPRIAQITSRVLPHDCLTLAVHHGQGAAPVHVRSVPEFPDDGGTAADDWGALWLVRDTRRHHVADGRAAFLERLALAGYQSLLGVRTIAHDRSVRLCFVSTRPEAYGASDVPFARRVVEAIAVAVSHQQLAEMQVRRAETRARSQRHDQQVRSVMRVVEREGERSKLVGESAEWRQVLRQAAQVASTADTTVFVRGESGTGKEVVARFIHRASSRRNGPFVAVNCAAIPEGLLESELFGHERGAFTGAHQAKAGQIELASTGVLFLDEVSEINPSAQAKLLRFLQEREFQRLGGTRPVKANVRVIAASHRDLLAAVADGSFREDLYYRLHVFDIHLPPLRDRRSDIPVLADSFLQEFRRADAPPARLSREATQLLMRYTWPGNIRQLRNALERATILSEGDVITPEHLSLHPDPLTAARRTTLPTVERRTIEEALRGSDGNKSKAARRLGITRTQLYGRLRKYGLAADDPGHA